MSALRGAMLDISEFTAKEIADYYQEFAERGEECNVLWQLEKETAEEWLEHCTEPAEQTHYAGYKSDGKLIGVCRYTEHPNFAANGVIGIAVRPSMRGKRFAEEIIKAMTLYCYKLNISRLTACVDENNERSLRAFRSAGWVRTGRTFDWRPNPYPRKAIEFIPSALKWR